MTFWERLADFKFNNPEHTTVFAFALAYILPGLLISGALWLDSRWGDAVLIFSLYFVIVPIAGAGLAKLMSILPDTEKNEVWDMERKKFVPRKDNTTDEG